LNVAPRDAVAGPPLPGASYAIPQTLELTDRLIRTQEELKVSSNGDEVDEIALFHRTTCNLGPNGEMVPVTFHVLRSTFPAQPQISRTGAFTFNDDAQLWTAAGKLIISNEKTLPVRVDAKFTADGTAVSGTARNEATTTSDGTSCLAASTKFAGRVTARRLFTALADRQCGVTDRKYQRNDRVLRELSAVKRLPSVRAARRYYRQLAGANRIRVQSLGGLDARIRRLAARTFASKAMPLELDRWLAARKRRLLAIKSSVSPTVQLAENATNASAIRRLSDAARRRDAALTDARRYAKVLGLQVCTRGDGATRIPPYEGVPSIPVVEPK
jgi:hypothetical protein